MSTAITSDSVMTMLVTDREPAPPWTRIFGLMPMLGVVGGAAWMLASVVRNGVGSWAGSAWVALALVQCAYMALQAWLWLRYRPLAPLPDSPPSLTVIIPAYNEGPMIERSIRSVAEADYPRDRLEVLVVDDGSRDDTYFHMEHLRRRYPELVRVIRFAGNRGKRAGLHAAFRAARGAIVATLDSDSEIDRGTLRALVAPFQHDARTGAVAGNVTVLNRDTLIGRMLMVQFALAFDFGRAAQSTYRAVACCPGALSAFRRAILLPHLDGWLNQQFLGRPVSHGEDQALTNIVLRAGYDTVYQRTAVVHTLTPERYRQLARMLTRWDRSFVVEGLAFARFMFTRYRPHDRFLPVVSFFVTNLRLVMLYVGLALLPSFAFAHPQLLPAYGLAFALGSLFPALYYLQNERNLNFLYGVLYSFYAFLFLQWTLPWAVVTVRDERWGTR
jgi:hyaluronan synthase